MVKVARLEDSVTPSRTGSTLSGARFGGQMFPAGVLLMQAMLMVLGFTVTV
jgi:hypothetical protein